MNDKVRGQKNRHLSRAIQRSHSCKKILSSYTGTVLLHQTRVLQLFLILLFLKKNSCHACMQIPHTNQNRYTKHDGTQGSLTYDVRNRYVEVKEGNE